jgi:hypothetical protein
MTRQVAVALAALAALIGATLAADTVVATPMVPRAQFTEDVEVTNGTWYCLPLLRENDTATVSVAAVGDDPSQVTIERFNDGESSFESPQRLEPDEVHEFEISGGRTPSAAVLRWQGGPVVASWRFDGQAQRVGASCTQSPAPQWTMTGANTTAGSTARLYLFNPFDSDAVVQAAFATPEGRVDLVRSENISVPSRSVVDLDLTELQPEQPDLGLILDVQAGRVVASGLQRFGQPELPEVELEDVEPAVDPNAPEGRTVLPATPVVETDVLGLAYAAAGENTTSWLSVLNASEEPASITVTVSDQVEGAALEQEIVVGPESVERVELDGLSSRPDFGVRVLAADEVTLSATAFTATIGDGGAVTAAPATTEPDAFSAQPASAVASASAVAVFNPGDVPATAAVSVGGQVPDDWSALQLEPGRMELLSVADVDVSAPGPVEVSADQPVHATLRLTGGDDPDRQLLTLPLVPANRWQGPADALLPERDRTLESSPVDFPAQQDE